MSEAPPAPITEDPKMTDTLASDEVLSPNTEGGADGLLICDGHTIPARFHPLAQLFPMIEGEAFKALVADVRENGVRRPIVLHEGMILDGRNRYLAAREAEVPYRVVEFSGVDPVAYVVSENLTRRHLTESQRAMIAARIAKLDRRETLVQNRSADMRNGATAAQAAAALNVSTRSVENAKAVVRDGAPELIAAVESGAVAVTAAAEVAKLPEPEQAEIVAKGPEAVREAAKEVRQAKVAEKAPAVPTEPVDPERRKLAKLTTDALIDEVIGLRANLSDEKAKAARLKTERDDLSARLAEALATDGGRTVANLRREITTLKARMAEHQTGAVRWERRAKKAEARVKELESMPIDMGRP